MEHHSTAKGRVARTRKSRAEKVNDGSQLIANETKTSMEKYNTGWFKPTAVQAEAINVFNDKDLILLQGVSGSGKSTTAIAYALKALSAGLYRQIIFIKTASETTDDPIGYLPSTAEDKISVHMNAMRSIFHEFMSKAKLELEEKRGKIQFTIPNFIAGKTISNSLVLIDESQMISPNILKLLTERCGEGSKYIVMGDKAQCYSAKKREDGFSHLVKLMTTKNEEGKLESKYPIVGYVEFTAKDNVRSELSRLIVEVYEKGL
jgi:predicted ribonuclease YlaK